MKKNIRSIVALLLVIFTVSTLFENNLNFTNNSDNNYISVYSDESINKNDTE